MSRISCGTPGTANTTLSSGPSAPATVTGHTSPGAVPRVCGMTVAPTGTSAWRRLLSGIRRPRLANSSRITSATASSGSRVVAHDGGDRLAGEVVVGGAEAAAHDDRVGLVEESAELVDDAADVVADLHLHEGVDAVRGELLTHPGRVRVDDLPEQELGADRQDVATHQTA